MSWFPVDDAFHGHPKARRAGFEAIGLWVVSGSYCMSYLTDGHVPEWFVKEKPRGLTLAKRLVAAGLWNPGEDQDGEPGWWFHDWKPECTKVAILEAREKARLRKAKSRESQRESRVTGRVTDAGQDAGVLGHIQPNPTQPSIPVETLEGEGTKADAHDAPRPQCFDHEENSDGPCRACRRRREWDEQHAEQIAADEVARRRDAKAATEAARAACRRCAGGGWLLDTDGTPLEPAVRCDHQLQADAR